MDAFLRLENPTEAQRAYRRWTLLWLTTAFVLFAVVGLLGLLMRLNQARWLSLPPELFYAILTLHGLGMVGTWFVAGMAVLGQILQRYVNPSLRASQIAYFGTLIAVLLLLTATLIGRLGVGWYFLYPLPFYPSGVWPLWASWVFLAFLTIAGLSWTIWVVDYLRAIASRYRLSEALAWPVLFRGRELDVPPVILIATVSLVAGLIGLLAAVVLLVLYYLEGLGTGLRNDALLMKNLTFFFGHVLVNITMYLGVAGVYALYPGLSGKPPLKTKRYVAAAWNVALLLVLLAYFHHLYMDFAQPLWFQRLGQIASYLSSIPAAVVTIVTVLALTYGARGAWTPSRLFLFLGTMGWAIGGMAAVIDSTILVNFRFHNTLWVPGHFHTYFLMGVVLMLLGFGFRFVHELSGHEEPPARSLGWLVALGGYGFLAMFFYGGVLSVPRRYAAYPDEVASGATLAQLATVFVLLLLTGLIIYAWHYVRLLRQAWSSG
jgi:cytochrome c oxidase subunit 1|nr:MAG: oxidase [Bacteroidota bacterium]